MIIVAGTPKLSSRIKFIKCTQVYNNKKKLLKWTQNFSCNKKFFFLVYLVYFKGCAKMRR